ncbi:hypothetical protein PMAYCL1PPCAC_14365, partial [Pristionchus mayeri]
MLRKGHIESKFTTRHLAELDWQTGIPLSTRVIAPIVDGLHPNMTDCEEEIESDRVAEELAPSKPLKRSERRGENNRRSSTGRMRQPIVHLQSYPAACLKDETYVLLARSYGGSATETDDLWMEILNGCLLVSFNYVFKSSR